MTNTWSLAFRGLLGARIRLAPKRAKFKCYVLIWLRDQRRGLIQVLKDELDLKRLQGAKTFQAMGRKQENLGKL